MWKNIRPAGEDFQRGDLLAKRGAPIRPAQSAVLASSGMATVQVFRRPRVAIISSGNELVDLDDFTQVIAGTPDRLDQQLHARGADARGGRRSRSTSASLPTPKRRSSESSHAAAGSDLIITSAGVSVGDLDHTRDVFASLGGKQKFWKVKMRPGAPLAFGLLKDVPWLGLSGNPVRRW